MSLQRCIDLAKARPEVLGLYLFGSRARDQAQEDSDHDFAIMLTPEGDPWETKLDLGAALSEAVASSVDLVVLGEDLDLTFRVLKEGKRLYARDHDRVCSEEATFASLYFDYEPFLRSYLESVTERFRRG